MADESVVASAPPTLDELRERFGDTIKQMRTQLATDFAEPGNDVYDDDLWLIRFCFNPKYNVDQCVERYRKMIRTRKEDGVDKIREKLLAETEIDIKAFPFWKEVNTAYPESLFHTKDIHGQPVAIQLLGRSDPKSLTKAITKDQLYTYTLHKAEYMRLTLDKMSYTANKMLQWVQVVDLDGLSMMKHMNASAMEPIKSASNRVDQMYKECFGRIYITNAPRVFHMIWAMVKLWVSERTAQKVVMMDGSYREQLMALIPADGFPVFFGGKQQTVTIGFEELTA